MTLGLALEEVLGEAQALGFIGPRPLSEHVDHAEGFGRVWARAAGRDRLVGRALDLGSGGGLPGLVLALGWPDSQWTLLDANLRRTAFLREAVHRVGLADRCRVTRGRAEELARAADERGSYDLVTARGFAAPPVTAECGAPFLRVGGLMIVSEPPAHEDEETRWPPAGLAMVGLEDAGVVESGSRYRVLRAVTACPDRYPRRVGIPEKRPLF